MTRKTRSHVRIFKISNLSYSFPQSPVTAPEKLIRPSFPLVCKVVNYGQTKCIMGNAYVANVVQYGVIF